MIVLRRRRPRRGRAGRDVRRLRQHRPDLHAHRADLRARVALRRVQGQVRRRPRTRWASARPTTSGRRWARWSRWTTRTGSRPTSTTPSRRAPPCSCGGKPRPDLGPAFFEPTILEGVTKDMLSGVTETFGPVVALHRYRTVDEAVALANDTDYGLNASVWGTRHQRRAGGRRAASSPATSTSTTSSPTAYASKGTPSGGVKSPAWARGTATRACSSTPTRRTWPC